MALPAVALSILPSHFVIDVVVDCWLWSANQKTQQNRNTTAKQKTQRSLTKPEKVGTLGRHESSLVGLVVRPLNKDMVYMFSKYGWTALVVRLSFAQSVNLILAKKLSYTSYIIYILHTPLRLTAGHEEVANSSRNGLENGAHCLKRGPRIDLQLTITDEVQLAGTTSVIPESIPSHIYTVMLTGVPIVEWGVTTVGPPPGPLRVIVVQTYPSDCCWF